MHRTGCGGGLPPDQPRAVEAAELPVTEEMIEALGDCRGASLAMLVGAVC